MKAYFIFASCAFSLALMQVNTSALQLSLEDWVNEPYICKDLMRKGKREHLIKRQRMASVIVIPLSCCSLWSAPMARAGDLAAWQGVLAFTTMQDWSIPCSEGAGTGELLSSGWLVSVPGWLLSVPLSAGQSGSSGEGHLAAALAVLEHCWCAGHGSNPVQFYLSVKRFKLLCFELKCDCPRS